jgi:hypothetical protein
VLDVEAFTATAVAQQPRVMEGIVLHTRTAVVRAPGCPGRPPARRARAGP